MNLLAFSSSSLILAEEEEEEEESVDKSDEDERGEGGGAFDGLVLLLLLALLLLSWILFSCSLNCSFGPHCPKVLDSMSGVRAGLIIGITVGSGGYGIVSEFDGRELVILKVLEIRLSI